MPKLKTVLKPNLKRDKLRREYRKQQGVYRTTYLALVNGRIRGTRPGYLWVHDLSGADSTGNNTYGSPYQLRMKAGAAIQYRPNWKVKVASEDGIELIVGMDELELERIGYDALQTNLLDPSLQFKLIEHLQNLQSFPNGDATVRVMPSIYRKTDGTYAIYGQMDVDVLTGNIPSAGNQVVACLWLKDDNTIQVTVSSEESRDTDLKQDPVAALTLINECAGLADVGVLGIWSYIIWDDTTGLNPKNKFHDLRGIVGVGSSGEGTLAVVTQPFYTQTVLYEDTLASSGSWDVSSISQDYDTLLIELSVRGTIGSNEELIYLSFNNDTTNANYRSGTGSGGSSTTSVVGDTRRIGISPGSTSPSNYFSILSIRIPDYTGSKEKVARGTTGGRVTTASLYTQESVLHWENSAAINRIAITTDNDPTDLFVAGSFIRIIGIKETDIVTSVTGIGGTDIDAIHDNVAAEISAITQKVTPVAADVLLIEDSADSFNKKYIEIGDLPGGSGAIAADTLTLNDGSELTIASDEITVTHARHVVDTESNAASDDLATVTGLGANQVCIITAADAGRTVVIKHGVDNISSATGADITLDDDIKAVCLLGNIGGTGVNAYPLQGGAGVDTTGAAAGDDVIADGAGSTAIRKNNFIATIAPTANDDSGDGYSVGSRWFDVTNDKIYECIDATLTAAIWIEVVGTTQTQTLTGKTISASANTIGYGAPASKTLASDVCSAGTDRNLVVSAESSTSDNLIEVTGLSVGETVLLRATSGHTITVVHNSGSATVKIHLNGDTNTTLDEQNPLELKLVATNILAQEKHAAGSTTLNNYAATAAPTANDDSGDGYSVGSRWFDVTNDKIYECIDATLTAAIWIEVVGTTQTQTLTGKTISASANTIGMGSGATKTLASDVCSAGTDRNIIVAAQSGVTDDLIEVTGLSVGESVLLRADAGDTITVKHNSGSATVKIYLHGNADITLDEQNPLRLTLIATNVMVEDVQNAGAPAGSAYMSYKSGSDYSTTSTSPVNVDGTNISFDVTTTGGDVLVWFIFAARKGGGAGSGLFDIIENASTDSPNIERTVNLSGANTLVVVAARFSPAAATNNYKLRYWTSDGTQVIIDADLTIQGIAYEVR